MMRMIRLSTRTMRIAIRTACHGLEDSVANPTTRLRTVAALTTFNLGIEVDGSHPSLMRLLPPSMPMNSLSLREWSCLYGIILIPCAGDLMLISVQWWADYNTKYLELATAWAAIHFPGFHIRHLRVPGLCKYQAAKWAHRLVARRAGLEHELPADHDTRRYVVADEGIDWDLM